MTLLLLHQILQLRSLDQRSFPRRLTACPCTCQTRRILCTLSGLVFVSLGWLYPRMPAFNELPMISVVHPAYHCFPKGGHGSFLPSANLRLSWDRVFATGVKLDHGSVVGSFRVRTFGRVCDGYSGMSVKNLQWYLTLTYKSLQLPQLRLRESSA